MNYQTSPGNTYPVPIGLKTTIVTLEQGSRHTPETLFFVIGNTAATTHQPQDGKGQRG